MAPGSGSGVKVTDIPIQQSELTTLKKSIIWKVKGISSIRAANAWEAITAHVEIADTVWKMHLVSDGKYLYAIPTIIQPVNAPRVYTLKTSLVNNNDIVIYTPGMVNKAAVSAASTKDPHRWEIMKFGDATQDMFSNYIFDDTLKILVDMTLYVQK